jgi:hypothetical protein
MVCYVISTQIMNIGIEQPNILHLELSIKYSHSIEDAIGMVLDIHQVFASGHGWNSDLFYHRLISTIMTIKQG